MGASTGGWLIDHGGYGPLNWVGLGFVLVAITISLWAGRQALLRTP